MINAFKSFTRRFKKNRHFVLSKDGSPAIGYGRDISEARENVVFIPSKKCEEWEDFDEFMDSLAAMFDKIHKQDK